MADARCGGPPNWQSMPSSMRWPVCPFAPSGLPIPGPTTSSPTPSESGKDRYFLHSEPYPDAYGDKPGHDGWDRGTPESQSFRRLVLSVGP